MLPTLPSARSLRIILLQLLWTLYMPRENPRECFIEWKNQKNPYELQIEPQKVVKILESVEKFLKIKNMPKTLKPVLLKPKNPGLFFLIRVILELFTIFKTKYYFYF